MNKEELLKKIKEIKKEMKNIRGTETKVVYRIGCREFDKDHTIENGVIINLNNKK